MRGTNWLGTRPLVHVGFLKSWLAGGLKYKVVSHILEAVQQCKQESESDQPVKIFVTGKHCVCSMTYLGEHRLAVVTTWGAACIWLHGWDGFHHLVQADALDLKSMINDENFETMMRNLNQW